MVKNSPANACDIRDVGSIPGSGRIPCRRKWQPTGILAHEQRRLVGYSPWGHKESDITEAT